MLKVEKAISPTSGETTWVLVDVDTFDLHKEALEYSVYLRGAGRSPQTQRAYIPRIAWYLNWCTEYGTDWRTVGLGELARFKFFIERTPTGAGRARSGKTVNAVLTAVFEFLRFCATHGHVPSDTVARLSEPRFLRHRPAGFDPGEGGQYLLVKARILKAPEHEQPPATVDVEQLASAVATARTYRDAFLVMLLVRSGVRIGEALGLRREDMHFLPNSKSIGCSVPGAHLHVVPRSDNANGARAKSGRSRVVPVTDEVIHAYRDYLVERDRLSDDVCDFVFVNLTGSHAGRPMSYSNTKQVLERMGNRAGLRLRPHMLRHTAATTWTRAGVPPDVVQELLGHASAASTAVYQHATNDDLRAAVDRIEALR